MAARANGIRELLHDGQCLRTELAHRNLIIGIISARARVSQLREVAAAEVSREHAGSRNETRPVGWVRPGFGSLIAREKEKLVFDDRPAYGAAVLISLQRVAPGSEKVPGIHLAITKELKQVAMEGIRARLDDHVDRRRRVQAVLRRERAGLDFELLQCIREWKRKIHRVKRVVMKRPI